MRRLSTAPPLDDRLVVGARLLRVAAGEREEHVVQARLVHGEGRRREARSVELPQDVDRGAAAPSFELSSTVLPSRSTPGWRPARSAARLLRDRLVVESELRDGAAELRLQTDGASSAITRPWSITATRWASRSASSRYCVVSRTVVPSLDELVDHVPELVAA